MNNETNRIAQIIANAADKELAVRIDGQPRRQDKAAALAIESEYLFIRRSELPEVGRCGCGREGVAVKGDCWDGDDGNAREAALEHLAVWQYREAKQDAANEARMELDRRRDELAGEHFEGAYDYLPREGYRKAIDRIIELEKKAA